MKPREKGKLYKKIESASWSLFMRSLFSVSLIWFFNFQSWRASEQLSEGAKKKREFDKGQNRNPLTFCCKWLTYDLLAFFSGVHSYGLWGCNGMRPHTIATCRLNTYIYIVGNLHFYCKVFTSFNYTQFAISSPKPLLFYHYHTTMPLLDIPCRDLEL